VRFLAGVCKLLDAIGTILGGIIYGIMFGIAFVLVVIATTIDYVLDAIREFVSCKKDSGFDEVHGEA